MVSAGDLRERLRQQRLLAIVRGGEPTAVAAAMNVLVEEGVELAEVSLSESTGLDAVRETVRAVGGRALIGAGTVLDAEQARAAEAAGAAFLVSPCVVPALGASPLPCLPGALTPTEIVAARALSPAAVKLFPAGTVGPTYVEAVRAPFPDLDLVPVGGIGPQEAAAFLAAGALAVGVGSPLVGDAAVGGDLRALRERARRLLEAVGR